MAVYVLAVLTCAAVLWISFRALAMQPAADDPGGEALRRLLAGVAAGSLAALEQLDAALGPPPPEGDDPLVAVGRAGRRRMAGYEQQLERIDGDSADGALPAARDLLAGVVEATGWACRLAESGGVRDNAGLRAALSELVDHGRRCAGEARSVLAGDAQPARK